MTRPGKVTRPDADTIASALLVLGNLPALMLATRTERGMSYRQAADAAGIARTHWYVVEKGERTAGNRVVVRILVWMLNPTPQRRGRGRNGT